MRHESLLYADADQFVQEAGSFLAEGVLRGEAVVAVVASDKAEALVRYLGPDASGVRFVDMQTLGRNPVRLTSFWRDFARDIPGPVRGIGEPIWAGRTPDEVVESQLHESLLDHLFPPRSEVRILCPYDSGALDASILEQARVDHMQPARSAEEAAGRYWSMPLPSRGPAEPIDFEAGGIRAVRRAAGDMARSAGMSPERIDELTLAISEVASNSVLHGSGGGTAWMWVDRRLGRFMCEIADKGRISDPFVGRFPPDKFTARGRGLWIANQLCDLVQVRTGPDGTVIRLQMLIDP